MSVYSGFGPYMILGNKVCLFGTLGYGAIKKGYTLNTKHLDIR